MADPRSTTGTATAIDGRDGFPATVPGLLLDRVSRSPDAVAYLSSLGLTPGTRCFVVEHAPFGGPLWVELDGQRHALGDTLANLVFGVVEPVRRVRP